MRSPYIMEQIWIGGPAQKATIEHSRKRGLHSKREDVKSVILGSKDIAHSF